MAVSILRTGKVYQVRAQADDTFYQGMMVSLSVSDSDMLKLALYGNEAMADRNEGEKIADVKAASPEKAGTSENSLDRALTLLHGAVKVEDHSSWEDRKSEKGLAYRTADAKAVLTRNGFMIPLYVKGIITRGEGKTVYTLFAADQASGRYFQPLLDKALKEAGK
ncbi:hypothetical protein [Dialister succinatiphilus]